MEPSVSHDREQESMAAKVRWFKSLTLEQRMDLLCAFTDLVLENTPQMAEVGRQQPVPGRIPVLTLPRP